MTHPQSFHEHLQFILKLFVLLRLESWGKRLIKRRNPKHILLPFTLGQVESESASLERDQVDKERQREWEALAGRQLGFWTRLCLNAILKTGVTMTRPGPPHETVERAGGGGGGYRAEWRMRGREAGCREPRGSPHPPSPGRRGAVGSRARGLRRLRDSACGLLRRPPGPHLTSSCSLSLSPASRRSLPPGFSSAPPGAVTGGCWGCSGALSLPPSSISTATAGQLRAHHSHRPVSQVASRASFKAPSTSRAGLRRETSPRPKRPSPRKPNENYNSQLPARHKHRPWTWSFLNSTGVCSLGSGCVGCCTARAGCEPRDRP